MKLLLVHPGPNFSVADVHTGWLEALQGLGVDARSLNLDSRLSFYATAGRVRESDGEFIRLLDEEGAVRLASKGIEAVCFEWWPDVVVFVSCFFVPMDTLDVIRARGIKVVILSLESPYEDDRQMARAEHATLNVINDPTNLATFQAIAPTIYLPHSYRPTVHCPGPVVADMACDFALVGTGYESRIEFLEAVDWTGIDVALAGNWQQLDGESPLRKFVSHDIENCVENTEAVALYRSTKASANIYRRESERPELSEGWSMGPREVELAATGTFYLSEARGENRVVLPMIPTFEGPEDFESQLRWWLAHPDERDAIATAARTAIVDRTFTNAATTLLRHLDGAKPKGMT